MHVVLFFTFDYSLTLWNETKILQREEIYYKKLVENFEDLHITFITYGDEEDYNFFQDLERVDILPIYDHIKYSKSKIIRFVKSFYFPYIIKKNTKNVDIIKQFQLYGSWVSILYKKLINKPLIIRTGYDMYKFSINENKSLFKQYLYKQLTRFSLKNSNLYTVTTNQDQSFLNTNFKNNNLVVRPNWTISKNIRPITDRHKTKVLSVGRLEKQKNFSELIQVFENSEFEIDIYGEGSERKKLEMFAKNLNSKVNFLGLLDYETLQKTYEDYIFFVTTSKFEGNPKTILEAQSAGCIVIALDEQNTNELIENGVSGIIVKNSSEILTTIKNLQYNEEKLNLISLASASSKNVKNELNTLVKKDYKDFLTLLNKNY